MVTMTTKERKKIEPIIESTRWKQKEVGYIGALVVGKDATELRECIKNTFVGLLADADLDEVKSALELGVNALKAYGYFERKYTGDWNYHGGLDQCPPDYL